MSNMFKDIYADLFAASLEFLGTTLFLLLGLGGIQSAAFAHTAEQAGNAVVNKVATVNQLMYISASMGLSLLASAWLFFRVTDGLFNPNVSFALLMVGCIKPLRFVLYCVAQLAGAIVASAILKGLLPGDLLVRTAPAPGVSVGKAVGIEMFLTAALVMAVLMLAAEKHRSTAFAPIGIGLTLFAGHLWGVVYTGASMNSARSFGPDVVLGFTETHWVYWVGPTLGALLSTGIYAALKHFNYDRLNPGQDTEDPQFSPRPDGLIRTISFGLRSGQGSDSAPRTETLRFPKADSTAPHPEQITSRGSFTTLSAIPSPHATPTAEKKLSEISPV